MEQCVTHEAGRRNGGETMRALGNGLFPLEGMPLAECVYGPHLKLGGLHNPRGTCSFFAPVSSLEVETKVWSHQCA